MVFQKQLKDNSRRITEVFEATGTLGGEILVNYLFRFITDGTERDESGHITRIIGHHEKTNEISEALYRRMLDNGAPREMLMRLFPETAKLVTPDKKPKTPTETKPPTKPRTRTKAATKPKTLPEEKIVQNEVS